MADRPILFSGPMVRALLAGTKTQTRRAFKGIEPVADGEWHIFNSGGGQFGVLTENVPTEAVDYLRIAVGDRLYVREAWRCHYTLDETAPRDLPPENSLLCFEADGEANVHWKGAGKFRQGMHLPRWASRITLTVTEVRVERVQDITEADALAEGMTQATAEAIMGPDELAMYAATHILCPEARWRILYETIWEQINGKESWPANPWVAAYSFTVERGNIDQLAGVA